MSITIITNNQARDVLSWDNLTEKERAQLDYDCEEHTFMRYKGQVYDLTDMAQAPKASFPQWDGYAPDTYFSGVLVRFTDWSERVIVARYYS